MPQRTITLSAPSPEWGERIETEKRKLENALGASCVRIHHIGSTAIKGIAAKPIIDILVETDALDLIDQRNGQMQGIGYVPKGEHDIPGRRYFQKEESGRRAFHLHVFVADSPRVKRHLAFRNGMNSHASLAKEYERVKRDALREAKGRPEVYQELKAVFIEAMTEGFLA